MWEAAENGVQGLWAALSHSKATISRSHANSAQGRRGVAVFSRAKITKSSARIRGNVKGATTREEAAT